MIIKKARQKDRVDKKIEQPLVNHGLSSVENTVVSQEPFDKLEQSLPEEPELKEPEPIIDLFDIENIDFTQRQERRRGSRRRGYRRIDDRNLVSRAQEESENICLIGIKTRGVPIAKRLSENIKEIQY